MKDGNLTCYRQQRKMTVTELANSVGVTEQTIRSWEKDQGRLTNARTENLLKLCKALKVTVDDIV